MKGFNRISFLTLYIYMYCSLPVLAGDTFQDPQWKPETADSTKPHIYCFFLYIYTYYKV